MKSLAQFILVVGLLFACLVLYLRRRNRKD